MRKPDGLSTWRIRRYLGLSEEDGLSIGAIEEVIHDSLDGLAAPVLVYLLDLDVSEGLHHLAGKKGAEGRV